MNYTPCVWCETLLADQEGAAACLQVVSVHKDGNAQSDATQPLEKHLREALCILRRQRIEEVSPQEIEQYAAHAHCPV